MFQKSSHNKIRFMNKEISLWFLYFNNLNTKIITDLKLTLKGNIKKFNVFLILS